MTVITPEFEATVDALLGTPTLTRTGTALETFADLFCGVGGFHVAAAQHGMECVFASDIDETARMVYEANFGIRPRGDIGSVDVDNVPYHDVLFAGLPCQPFSIIGQRKGFAEARGNLFLEAARIIAAKRPRAVVIENVKQFRTNRDGKAMRCVLATLEALGYTVDHAVLNALDFGLPQKRERVFIVATDATWDRFPWPEGGVEMTPLADILEDDPDPDCFASRRIREARKEAHTADVAPAVWHENKGGNVSSHPYSCALRAGASHNYLLVDGVRRFTARELFRLQGFPDSYKLPDNISQARKLAGNAVAVPVVEAVLEAVLSVYRA